LLFRVEYTIRITTFFILNYNADDVMVEALSEAEQFFQSTKEMIL
jgi:hypothetical protein